MPVVHHLSASNQRLHKPLRIVAQIIPYLVVFCHWKKISKDPCLSFVEGKDVCKHSTHLIHANVLVVPHSPSSPSSDAKMRPESPTLKSKGKESSSKKTKTAKKSSKSSQNSSTSESKSSKKRKLNPMELYNGSYEREEWEFFVFDEKSESFWAGEMLELDRQRLLYDFPALYHQQRLKKREEASLQSSSSGGRVTRSDARKIQQAEQQHQQQQFMDQYGLGEMEEIAEESGSISVPSEPLNVDLEKKTKRRKTNSKSTKQSSKHSNRNPPVEQTQPQIQLQQAAEEFYSPSYPIQVNKTLFVYDFGEIIDRPNFYNKLGHHWPVGYKVSRRMENPYNPKEICEYFCQIIDGNAEPLFQINFRDVSSCYCEIYYSFI
eukprot:TRINITY_DN2222_c0_g1_i4.p2 TRINITY_DN2222_c0_g1~~TRINITY_DN2222_c0_g1_i4.p2  ORF type:complete len:377 (+),score=127.79 TRINITY_DN2222_c0_g1_i4:2666-3796(+)